jgi:hydroxyethylthiazole kinase
MSNSASSFTGVSSGYTAGTPVPADSPIRDNIADAVRRVRETTPLAQSFTNFVTINLVANAQLAAGGTAAMSFLPDDVIETAKIAGANYINVGTLLPFYKDALPEIAQRLNYLDKPWVLDPVAAGIGRTRTAILQAFKAAPPTMIRANASEVIALANMWGLNTETVGDASEHRPAGVESVDDVESATGAAVAQYLTEQHAKHSSHDASTRCAVAVSGIADLVTDGETVYRLPGGSAMMTKITGAGCSLGGVAATYLAVSDPLTAALSASLLYNRAGEVADTTSHGPGSFQVAFLDALWNVTAEQVAKSEILVQ